MINLQILPIDRLKPAPYNPRIPLKPGTPEFQRLERSLNEFSLVQPIVWNEQTGHVVAGHQRLEVLKQQGVMEVDVAVVSLPLEREMALNITLNNAQVGGDWDTDKLMDLLTQLQELPDFDATLSGFDEQDLRDLMLRPEPNPQPAADDAADDDTVHISLDVPADRWEEARPEFDRFIGRFNLNPHIKLPC